jgi:hypothetical protein
MPRSRRLPIGSWRRSAACSWAPDELNAWFGGFNAYKRGGADVSHWLSMFGGCSLKVDRKGGDRPTIYVPRASVSVCGTIQPGTIARAMTQEHHDNGLVPRLLVAMPAARAKRMSDTELSDATQSAVREVFSRLFDLRMAPGLDGEDEPVFVDLTEDARELHRQFVNAHGEETFAMKGAAQAVWAKLECYAARFALIFHCVRQASGEKTMDFVDEGDVANGIDLARWFGGESSRVYGQVGAGIAQRERRELLELIQRLGGVVSTRDLIEHSRLFRKSEEAEVALNRLVDEGMGGWEVRRTGGRGRPATVFCLADSPDYPISDRHSCATVNNSHRENTHYSQCNGNGYNPKDDFTHDDYEPPDPTPEVERAIASAGRQQ